MDSGRRETPNRTRGPRLYHTKSRTGCSRCRARRVKCDESRPVCNNCHRHNVACEYDRSLERRSTPRVNQRAQTQPPGSSPGSASGGYPEESSPASSISPNNGLRSVYWEMKALHHFTVSTSHTLPGGHLPSVKECWSVHVPLLALDDEPLLSELLAISALHLISTGCTHPELLNCRAKYLDAALRAHRQTLDRLSSRTPGAACFTSILLLVDAFATLRDRQLDPYEPPVQWLRIVHGARVVFDTSYNVVTGDPTSPIMTIIKSAADILRPQEIFNEANMQKFPYLLQNPLHGTAALIDDVAEITSVYQPTVSYIGSIRTAVEAEEPTMALCRRLMSFATLIPPRFLELVEEKVPRALIILAHFFALSTYAKDMWWIGQTPYREVHAIRGQIHPTLHHLLDWPLKTLAANDK